MYVILGASGNTGSIIANSLLLKGQKVRVMGRDAGRLERFVRKGAEVATANVSDAAALTKAFSGARAAYLMLPPSSREDQERQSDAIAKAVKESGLRYAVHLAYFMENNLAAIDMIQGMGMFGHALLPDLKLPMIATQRRRRLRRATPAGPGFFRQTNARTAWRARPVDDGSYSGDCARHW